MDKPEINFQHHMQKEILGCKRTDDHDVTKLRNETKQLKFQNDEPKKNFIRHIG